MKALQRIFLLALLAFACTQCSPLGSPDGRRDVYYVPPPPEAGPGSPMSMARMMREVNLKVDMVPSGTQGRKVVRPMVPRFINTAVSLAERSTVVVRLPPRFSHISMPIDNRLPGP